MERRHAGFSSDRQGCDPDELVSTDTIIGGRHDDARATVSTYGLQITLHATARAVPGHHCPERQILKLR
jgi:hypothetical protein